MGESSSPFPVYRNTYLNCYANAKCLSNDLLCWSRSSGNGWSKSVVVMADRSSADSSKVLSLFRIIHLLIEIQRGCGNTESMEAGEFMEEIDENREWHENKQQKRR
eukprot:gene12342-8470_t